MVMKRIFKDENKVVCILADKTEEAFIVNFADSIDATMNKVSQIKEKTESDTWSEYDRRIETKLYL